MESDITPLHCDICHEIGCHKSWCPGTEFTVSVPGGGNADYLRLLDEMRNLHLKKAADYGVDHDPLANLRASAELGIEPWRATVIRLFDKMSRLKTFCRTGKLANEGVEDTLLDAAAYSLLALVLFREEKSGNAPMSDLARLHQMNMALAERVCICSQLLGKKAEKTPSGSSDVA